jgi:hypothetical protein
VGLGRSGSGKFYPAQDAQPAAEGEPGDADGRATAGGDGQPVGRELVVHLAEACAGADPQPAVLGLDPVHRARSMSTPVVLDCPVKLWPPARTATGSPCSATTAAVTSSGSRSAPPPAAGRR